MWRRSIKRGCMMSQSMENKETENYGSHPKSNQGTLDPEKCQELVNQGFYTHRISLTLTNNQVDQRTEI
jgi:hypothetical protein